MKELRVKIIEIPNTNTDPERRFHLWDIEKGKICLGNLKKEEIPYAVEIFNIAVVEEE